MVHARIQDQEREGGKDIGGSEDGDKKEGRKRIIVIALCKMFREREREREREL